VRPGPPEWAPRVRWRATTRPDPSASERPMIGWDLRIAPGAGAPALPLVAPACLCLPSLSRHADRQHWCAAWVTARPTNVPSATTGSSALRSELGTRSPDRRLCGDSKRPLIRGTVSKTSTPAKPTQNHWATPVETNETPSPESIGRPPRPSPTHKKSTTLGTAATWVQCELQAQNVASGIGRYRPVECQDIMNRFRPILLPLLAVFSRSWMQ